MTVLMIWDVQLENDANNENDVNLAAVHIT